MRPLSTPLPPYIEKKRPEYPRTSAKRIRTALRESKQLAAVLPGDKVAKVLLTASSDGNWPENFFLPKHFRPALAVLFKRAGGYQKNTWVRATRVNEATGETVPTKRLDKTENIPAGVNNFEGAFAPIRGLPVRWTDSSQTAAEAEKVIRPHEQLLLFGIGVVNDLFSRNKDIPLSGCPIKQLPVADTVKRYRDFFLKETLGPREWEPGDFSLYRYQRRNPQLEALLYETFPSLQVFQPKA